MPTSTQAAAGSKTMLWAGRIISGLVILFLLFDSSIKLIELDVVRESMLRLGYPEALARGMRIGILEFVCLVLYVIPRTSILGAILLTGLMGGAISSHLRVGDPLFTHTMFGVYLGALVWAGLYLRDDRLRALVPLRRQS